MTDSYETVLKTFGWNPEKVAVTLEEQSDIVRIGEHVPKSAHWYQPSYLNLAEALLDAQKADPMSPEESKQWNSSDR
jgi:hypothetical protein